MREKTRPTVDVAAVTAAWDAFLTSTLPVSKESLNEQGWKDADDLEELGMNWRSIMNAVNDGTLEKKHFCVKNNERARDRSFYRPKV
jgi:hypothetical protein